MNDSDITENEEKYEKILMNIKINKHPEIFEANCMKNPQEFINTQILKENTIRYTWINDAINDLSSIINITIKIDILNSFK